MTFSKPLGATEYECDDCGGRVGSTWREQSQHLCPRIVADPFADPDIRVCNNLECGRPLRRRDGESATDFRSRRHCNRSCSIRARR